LAKSINKKFYFPFTYEPTKSIEVLSKSNTYFEKNNQKKMEIEEIAWAILTIGKVIPQTTDNLWSGHFFPYMESWDEMQISFNLALLGLYKQAFVSLRSSLELGMLSVYYNINDDGQKTVKKWLKSEDSSEANTPRFGEIWKILYTNQNIFLFEERYNLRNRFNNLNILHNYVHTKGIKYSNKLGLFKSNFQTFEEAVLNKWIETYKDVAILIITLHLLRYPIGVIEYDWDQKVGIDNPFPVLSKYEIERLREILPQGYIDFIVELADKDKSTQGLFEDIKQLPNMSEEEVEKQITDLAKRLIENGNGFVDWEKQQLKLIKSYSESSKQKALKRISMLKKWAIKNDYMESKLYRLIKSGIIKNPKVTNT